MMIRWTERPEVTKRLIELDASGLSQREIANQIEKEFRLVANRDQVKNALARARASAPDIRDRFIPELTPYYNKYRPYIEGDVVLEKNLALFAALEKKPRLKILVLSDIHVPYTDENKLAKAIDLNRSADLVVLGGDVMDSYSLSRWRKQTNMPFYREMDMTVRLLEYLSATFPAVVVIPGNHDQRATKQVQSLLPQELLFLFDTNPLQRLIRPFPNIIYHDNWYIQIGDAIIGHPERSSIVDGKPAMMFAEWFLYKGWAHRLKLDPYPRLFVTAHTHQVSSMYRENIKAMESGCLATIMEYATDSSAVMRPPQNGCVLITQNNGVSDFINSREFFL